MSEYIFKTIVVGDEGVGKTSITLRFTKDFFDPEYKTTIGVSYAVKKIVIENAKIMVSIWDTGGQEIFDYIRPRYYDGALGALAVFDVTQKKSFENLDRWVNDVSKQCGEIPIIVVGNKIDLIDERVVNFKEAEEYTTHKNVIYYETSAKTGENVVDVVYELSKKILEDIIYEMHPSKKPKKVSKKKKKKTKTR